MRKALKLYSILSELIIVSIGLGLGGYFLGEKLKPDTKLNVILACIGIALAFILNILMIFQVLKQSDRTEDKK